MNKKFLIPVISLVVIVVIVGIFMIPVTEDKQSETLSVSYNDANKYLKSELSIHDISMSSPLKLNGVSIEKYCTFFADTSVQNAIEYCTSTELLDSNGKYLGNIHIVGVNDSPKYAIGVIQADPQISQLDDIKTIYNIMIEYLVCDCWAAQKPGEFNSVSDWIDAANTHHLEAKRITSKSEINGLAQKDLLLEITTNTEGYLWKFIIPT